MGLKNQKDWQEWCNRDGVILEKKFRVDFFLIIYLYIVNFFEVWHTNIKV